MLSPSAQLLQDAVAGDAKAFDALVGPLVEMGYRLAATMLRSREEAEDAVQEATIKAWLNLGRVQDADAVRSWFLTIVANQCRSIMRGHWWSVVRQAEPEQISAGPEESAVQRTDLGRALAGLNREDRLALHLRYYLDLPLSEVAAVLGVSETAAKSKVHRAAGRLRPALAVGEVAT